MTNAQSAEKFFRNNFLCSQSILLTYADLFGMEAETAARIASPFGGGVARRGDTCGAVNGALMVLGLNFGHTSGDDLQSKEMTYQNVTDFISQFELRHGSILCRELLNIDISSEQGLQTARDSDLFTTRCPRFVHDAAEILDQILFTEEEMQTP